MGGELEVKGASERIRRRLVTHYGSKRPVFHWRQALLVSLLVHGAFGLCLTQLAGPAPPANTAMTANSAFVLYPVAGQPEARRKKSSPDPWEEAESGSGSFTIPIVRMKPDVAGPQTIQTSYVAAKPASNGSTAAPNNSRPSAGSGLGQGSGTGQGGTSFFQIATHARRVVYVIDQSSSMGQFRRLDTARRELLVSLQKMPADAAFQIIVYNSTARVLLPAHPDWLTASESNRQLAADALAQLEPEGGTRHDLALPLALALQPEVVYFLTDADDLTLAYVRQITSQNRHGAVIHVLELNPSLRNDPNTPLQMLARENGGVYRAVGGTMPR
jgi:hypothetical protein